MIFQILNGSFFAPMSQFKARNLLKNSDIISLHTPLTEDTKNIISSEAISMMKKGSRIINCARGGLVDEVACRAALENKHLAGAAFDVFVEEPARENILFEAPNFIATPHLGAATLEAQENVALQIAQQMSDYLLVLLLLFLHVLLRLSPLSVSFQQLHILDEGALRHNVARCNLLPL